MRYKNQMRIKILIYIIFLIASLFITCCKETEVKQNETEYTLMKEFNIKENDINIKVLFNKKSISVVEQLKMQLEIQKPQNYIVIFPDIGDIELDNFEIIEVSNLISNTNSENNIDILKRNYTLLPEGTRKGTIKSITVQYLKETEADNNITDDEKTQTYKTSSIEIPIETYTKKAINNLDIKESRQPETIEPDYTLIIIISISALLFIAILGISTYLILHRKKKYKEEQKEIIPAHIIALDKLSKLEKEDLINKGEIDEFHRRLSLIIREYIENRYDIQAPEQTTEEFIIEMSTSKDIKEEHKNLLKDYLTQCDLIKFAKFVPPLSYHQKALESAKTFIENTKIENETGNIKNKVETKKEKIKN
ncbi:MAG: hypothetical protein ACOCV8_01700 [Spirochaetota bacterium]